MLVHHEPAHVTVKVSAFEVWEFNQRWPCSTIPLRDVQFVFNKRSGNLVDMVPPDMDGEAVLALSQDASHIAGLTP